MKAPFFLAFSFLTVPLMFGSTNNCNNSTASSPVSNGTVPSTTQTIPGAPGTANDLGSAIGCTAVNMTFSNFTGSFTGAGANGIETLGGTYMAETPAGTANTSLDTLLFATVRGSAGVPTDGNSNDGNNNWIANSHTTVTDEISYSVTDSAASVASIVLTAFGANVDPSAGGSIIVDVCEGIATSATITSTGACGLAGGTFVTQTLTLSTLASQSLTISLGAPTSFDITTEIILSGGGGSHIGSFDDFTESFDDGTTLPEPSTFVLMGTALAGIGFLRSRRRKA